MKSMKLIMENFNKFLAEDSPLLAETAIGDYQIVVDGTNAKAMLGDRQVGTVEAEPHAGKLQVQWAEVEKDHQRKGLGSAMYDALEKESGMDLIHGDIRSSPSALRMWKKRLGETDEWMLNYYIDGLYNSTGYIQDRLGLPYGSENYTDEQVEQIAREDLGL